MTDKIEFLTENVLSQTATSFDIEKFDEIVKNIRLARKALTDETNDVDYVKTQLATAHKNMEIAIGKGDMEAYNEQSGEVRKYMKKLNDGPRVHEDKFNRAMNALAEIAQPLATEEQPEVADITDAHKRKRHKDR